jgi:beta-lactamase regulating signal transducer with metallopeptidase domain
MNTAVESTLAFVLNGLWRASWQASLLALLVLVVQKVLGKRLGGRGRFALWAIVVVRLLLPVLPESRWSLFNLARGREIATKTVANPEPRETRSIPVIVIGAPPVAKPQAAAHEATAVSTKPAIQWRVWIFAAWVAGIIVLASRVAQVCWGLSRTIRMLSVVSDQAMMRAVQSCAASLRLRRIPVVLAGENVTTPAVVGLFRPKLLLPSHVLELCDPREIRLIILHELAHLKRHDIAGNWLIAVASIVHWFNPIVWLAAARMRADRELACDELVLSASSGEAQAYGRTLLKLIEILSPKMRALAISPRQLAIVGILESSTPMQRRVRMIAQFDAKKSGRWMWTALVLAPLAMVALTDAVRGDNKPAPIDTNPAAPTTQQTPVVAPTPQTSIPSKASPDMEIRAYDINDLIQQGQDRNTQITAVTNAITNLIDRPSWTEANIGEVNGKLVIRQTAANHDKIAELLNLLHSEPSTKAPQAPVMAPGATIFPGGAEAAPAMAISRSVVADPAIETANAKALDTLHKKLPEVKLENVNLSDAVDYFRDVTGANIAVNWRALEAAGVDRNAPVSIRMKDADFETILDNTLRQVSDNQAALVIDRGIITITTEADVSNYMLTKTYDVTEVVNDAVSQANPMQSLVGVVQSLSPNGMIVQSFGTKLIVTAEPNAHEQVEKLLAELRKSSTTQPSK